MPNETKNRTLIEQLKNDKTTELMPHDLSEMLDQELSKPAEEVDTQLVQDLLELLNAEAPTQQAKDECWNAIQAHTRKNGRSGRNTALRRLCAIAAALVIVIFVSFRTANAFNWSCLLKLLGPAMETFGIYSTNNPPTPTETSEIDVYSDEFTEYEQVNYSAPEDMPTTLKGYTIVPGWVPERYTFASGSIYEDNTFAIASIFFQDNDKYLSMSVSFYENEEDAMAYVYESTPEHEQSMQVDRHSVTYYHNDHGEIHAASAIAQNVHLYIGGSVSESELAQILSSMNQPV